MMRTMFIVLVVLFLVAEFLCLRKPMWKITFYCDCKICCGKWSGTKKLDVGMCAVDPLVIPLHSTVYIRGLGTFRAEDTGKDIKGHCIDVYVPSHQKAKELGVQWREVKWKRSLEKE